jgi:hypothetical protein
LFALNCGSNSATNVASTDSVAAGATDAIIQQVATDGPAGPELDARANDGAASIIVDSGRDAPTVEGGLCPPGKVYCSGCNGSPGTCYAGGCPPVACPPPELLGFCGGLGTCPIVPPGNGTACSITMVPACCNYQIGQLPTGCFCNGKWTCNPTAMCGCVGQ